MRIFSLLLPVALSVGCGGSVVAQQIETQPVASGEEQTPAAVTGGQPKEVVNTLAMRLMAISRRELFPGMALKKARERMVSLMGPERRFQTLSALIAAISMWSRGWTAYFGCGDVRRARRAIFRWLWQRHSRG